MECPICTKDINPRLIETWMQYKLYYCPDCEGVFSDPMKNPGAEWYEQSAASSVGKFVHTSVSWHHQQFLDDPFFYGQRLLDIGCGTGVFLKEANKKGYNGWGFDFDSESIKIARERYGLKNVYAMDLNAFSKQFAKETFDIITFFEVLEHMDSPKKFIGQVRNLLRTKGHIALSVPNRDRTLDPFGEADYPPHHLTRWSKSCLSAFLERNGFEIIKCIVKKLDPNDIAGYLNVKIRFGIARNLVEHGPESKKQENIQRAATLAKVKGLFFKGFTFPLAPFLSIFHLQGIRLYCLARLK